MSSPTSATIARGAADQRGCPQPPRRRLMVTRRARRALGELRAVNGVQAIVVSWPSGLAFLPVARFTPSAFDVVIGHIAGCPVLADVRQMMFYRDRSVLIDLAERARRRTLLRIVPLPAEFSRHLFIDDSPQSRTAGGQ